MDYKPAKTLCALMDCKPLLDRYRVRVFSSNYALYGDMSRRVMTVLAQQEPEVEVYSIDEAFFALPLASPEFLLSTCRDILNTTRKTNISRP